MQDLNSRIESYTNLPTLQKLKRPRIWMTVLAVLVIALIARQFLGSSDSNFRLAKIHRGDLDVTVTASGTVQPEEVIDVGAQVAGRIVSFGTDSAGKPIDYGSQVQEGTVLALIDDALYNADVSLAESELKRSQADSDQLKAKLIQATQDWQRAQKIGTANALSQSAFEGFKAAYLIAQANVAVGDAAIAQALAKLDRAKRNLSYCTIKSPVSGVIIDRRVNIGQTVVSSLNAPSLFLLAKDLTRLQIWAAVNEADIGSIHPGQAVQFTVATLPGQILTGTVRKIRLNAAMTQNVVTYTVEITTANPDRKLLPYLTADVRFIIEKRPGVLLVPNAALRWTPKAEQIAPGYRDAINARAKGDTTLRGAASSSGTLWIPDGRNVKPIFVNVLAADSVNSEVSGEDLTEEQDVVIGSLVSGKERPAGASPFTPQMNRGGNR